MSTDITFNPENTVNLDTDDSDYEAGPFTMPNQVINVLTDTDSDSDSDSSYQVGPSNSQSENYTGREAATGLLS